MANSSSFFDINSIFDTEEAKQLPDGLKKKLSENMNKALQSQMEKKANKDLEENLEKIITDENERTIIKKEIEQRVITACDALKRKRKYMQENVRRKVVAKYNNVIEDIVQKKMLHEKKENFSDVVKFEEAEYKNSVEKKNQHNVDQGHESQSRGPYKSHGGKNIQERNRHYGRNSGPRGYVSNDYQRSLDKSEAFSPERRDNY